MRSLAALGRRLLGLIYPPRCVFCGALLEAGSPALGTCRLCRETMPRTGGRDAVRLGLDYTVCAAPLRYEKQVVRSLRRFKFQGRPYYAGAYGPLLRACAAEHFPDPPDLVTWAPLHWRRRYARGYDQARLLAEEAALAYQMRPVRLLVKARYTRPQSSLPGRAREQNAAGAYRLCRKAEVSGRRILLIDDIVTTGSTLSACSRVLLEAGAAEVFCLALARGGVRGDVEKRR